uniref:Uncharacterized protein n=1 Tax=Timema bartmani TaxID=61472 RepID=A0A7R9FCY5_9NEOP|nr:unnamed protein product [Timema bartmani]
METGYNKDFHQYKILIIDKPLSPHYQVAPIDQDVFLLNQTITCLNEAVQFLGQFPGHCEVMARLNSELHNVCATLKGESPLLAREKMYELIKAHWGAFLGTHPVDRQRSGHFQNQLTIALENWVVNCLHEVLFPLVCAHYQLEDEHILTRAIDLASAGVTADQLGASQHFAVPLPAAVCIHHFYVL